MTEPPVVAGAGAAPGTGVDLGAPRDVRWIAERLEAAGFETWAVGGAVRDALAGRRPGDWDLATAARPADVRRVFRRTVPVGIEHGTVGVLGRDRRMYEVTTFRRDVETFGRHAVVAFADRLEDDLDRRDFTINAVAWHPLRRELRDPHGGSADLAAGVLRTVGAPEERFAEDRLRVLRAFRFAGRFGLRIDPSTWSAMVAAAPELPHLSAERIREELNKLMSETERPSVGLRLYAESGALRALYPELEALRTGVDGAGAWDRVLAIVDAVPRHRPRLRVVALLSETGRAGPQGASPGTGARGAAAARAVLRRLKASNAETDAAVHLIAHLDGVPAADATDASVRRWLRGVGREHIPAMLRLLGARARASGDPGRHRETAGSMRRVRRILHEGTALEVADLAIGGAELRSLGIRPGPAYGEILRELMERVTDDPSLNRAERLLALASAMADQRSTEGGGG
jgi:tRNA nucleotidyltransferase (CCA-adding enzyme)